MQFMICSKRLWTREKMLIAFVFILQLAENLTKLGFFETSNLYFIDCVNWRVPNSNPEENLIGIQDSTPLGGS